MPTIVGVFREAEFSPGRVADDAAILEHTGAALEARGFAVRLGSPALALAPDVDAVLAMCQSAAALATLDAISGRVPVINTVRAIRHCFRDHTVRLLAAARVSFPATRMVATEAEPPAHVAPCWVKRGDVHATADGDVGFAADDDALRAALSALRARGVACAALQAHVEGPIVKFYGIVDGRFFRCHSDREDAPASIAALWNTAYAGAAALGLEVFGGDLVVSTAGTPVLIDVNDWPSFSRCRDDAAHAIAEYVTDRLVTREVGSHGG